MQPRATRAKRWATQRGRTATGRAAAGAERAALGWRFGTDLSLSGDPLLGHGSLGLLHAEQRTACWCSLPFGVLAGLMPSRIHASEPPGGGDHSYGNVGVGAR